MDKKPAFKVITHEADFCVVGGGIAGLCAAVSAARHGAKTVLMHDRPVLGGNSSSEVRVHVCGADRHNGIKHMRETGILEELRLENLRRNPNRVFSIWDTILYEAARFQENLTLLLNCSCVHAGMGSGRIESLTGWQLTTQVCHKVLAEIFADCSGDAILAPMTGADYRVGREGRGEFGEPLAPPEPDNRTMGMTCLFQARPHEKPQPFEPPGWAYRFDRCEDLPYGPNGHRWIEMGYWWVELGGEHDSIADTEHLRDELLKMVYGVWDHIKNRCPRREEAAHWALEWVQFLPGKRESRRYVGAHTLTQNDIEREGKFDDVVAYGGWTMDDHHPAGFRAVRLAKPATHFHTAPSPYGIPYRCLYSRNVGNLMFAGRCASASHLAMSSTRVMGTGATMGHAVGTAAAMACRLGAEPADMKQHMPDIQQALLRDDCYLPGLKQEMSDLTTSAQLTASREDPQPLRDGVNRQVGEDAHCWTASIGDWVCYELPQPHYVTEATLILDSAMHSNIQMSFHQKDDQLTAPPPEMPRAFRIEVLHAGQWTTLHHVRDNHQRLRRFQIAQTVEAIRWVLEETWGASESRLYAFYLDA